MGTISNDISTIQALPGTFAPNLFEVYMFGRDTLAPTGGEELEFGTNRSLAKADERFFCSKVDIPGFSMEYETRHKALREIFPKEAKIAEDITITWVENHRLDVWNYHRKWLTCFYLREKDQYVSGSQGKKRTAIVLIHPVPGPDGSIDREAQQAHVFRLEGLLPVGTQDLSLDWGWGGEGAFVPMKYKVDRILYLKEGTPSSEVSGMDLL
jgi:hypothetical protein